MDYHYKHKNRYISISSASGDVYVSNIGYGIPKEDKTNIEFPPFDEHSPVYMSIYLTQNCNLNCKYCFNENKTKVTIDFPTIKNFIDIVVKKFNKANKYFVDPSGCGEPLLEMELLEKIGEYCSEKSNEIKREILVQLVTNGTLLSGEYVKRLRKANILFGISIDGNKKQNRNRIYFSGEKVYDDVLSNIRNIEERKLIGAAATLTINNYNVKKIFTSLYPLFSTISIKPVRSSNQNICFTSQNIKKLCNEYSKFYKYLSKNTIERTITPLLTILNGDDYFGKFISRVFLNKKISTRCDAGIRRFTLESDGTILSCASAKNIKSLKLENLDNEKNLKILTERVNCIDCYCRYVCGGECLVNSYLHFSNLESIDSAMCILKKHLFLLSVNLLLDLTEHMEIFQEILTFLLEKEKRFTLDLEIDQILNLSGNRYTFLEIKKIKDNNPSNFKKILSDTLSLNNKGEKI